MGYDISLVDKEGKVLHSKEPHNIKGGQYPVGGTTELSLYITYNYAPLFREKLGQDGIRWLYGKRALDTVPTLVHMWASLGWRGGVEPDPDYWKPTKGNVREAVKGLILLALEAPEGIWQGD